LGRTASQRGGQRGGRGGQRGGRGSQQPRQTGGYRQQHARTLAEAAVQRSTQRRGNRIDQMRGLQSNNKRGGNNNNSNLSVTVSNVGWVKQQKLRRQQANKKLQEYKATNSATAAMDSGIKISVPNKPFNKPFQFDAPNKSDNGSYNDNRGNNNQRGRGGRRGGRGAQPRRQFNDETTRTRVTDRSIAKEEPNRRITFQNRQADAVAKRRGLNSSGSSINEKFSNNSDDGNRSYNNNRSNNSNRGFTRNSSSRGSGGMRGGRGRGRGRN